MERDLTDSDDILGIAEEYDNLCPNCQAGQSTHRGGFEKWVRIYCWFCGSLLRYMVLRIDPDDHDPEVAEAIRHMGLDEWLGKLQWRVQLLRINVREQ